MLHAAAVSVPSLALSLSCLPTLMEPWKGLRSSTIDSNLSQSVAGKSVTMGPDEETQWDYSVVFGR